MKNHAPAWFFSFNADFKSRDCLAIFDLRWDIQV